MHVGKKKTCHTFYFSALVNHYDRSDEHDSLEDLFTFESRSTDKSRPKL